MGSPTFQQLQSPTAPLFKDIYFFNLTNPEEFEAGAKPQLQEVGPYSYAYVFCLVRSVLMHEPALMELGHS